MQRLDAGFRRDLFEADLGVHAVPAAARPDAGREPMRHEKPANRASASRSPSLRLPEFLQDRCRRACWDRARRRCTSSRSSPSLESRVFQLRRCPETASGLPARSPSPCRCRPSSSSRRPAKCRRAHDSCAACPAFCIFMRLLQIGDAQLRAVEDLGPEEIAVAARVVARSSVGFSSIDLVNSPAPCWPGSPA